MRLQLTSVQAYRKKTTPRAKLDLSPIAAECGSISACSTQNKAKRANKIVFLLLIPDQEVDGSNPFARPLLLGVRPELTTYNRRRSGRPLGARPRRSAVQFDSASDSSTQKACPDLSTNRSLAVQGQRSNKARQRRITDYWRYKWRGTRDEIKIRRGVIRERWWR